MTALRVPADLNASNDAGRLRPEPVALARRIGEAVAAEWADAVDRDARFPTETLGALRASGLLGVLVPAEFGGMGATMAEAAAAVTAIAEHCASSGLIFAMHNIQVLCMARHANPAANGAVLPRVARGEMLLANANSEVGLGGDRRASNCALEPTADGFHLDKQASTVSYGANADGLLATARRNPGSPSHDQVSAICLLPELRLEPTGEWDTLGLRGTCSQPFSLSADVAADYVLEDWSQVFVRTSLPASAVLLSSVWLGIAEAAARRAHAYVRAQARKARAQGTGGGSSSTSALRLAELGVVLHELREVLRGGVLEYERCRGTDEMETFGFTRRMDNLKVSSSTLVGEVVRRALGICGIAGYQNNSPYSLARVLRDAAAAPLMVNNDRALAATAETLLIGKEL